MNLERKEIKEIEAERFRAKREQMLHDVEQVRNEREGVKEQENLYRTQAGFTDFPYTHGDAIEKLRMALKAEANGEMRSHLEAQK